MTDQALSKKFREVYDPWMPTQGRTTLFAELRDTGRLVFLLDGLDQMPAANYPAVLEELLPIVKGGKNNGLLLATRRTPARDLEDRRELTFLQLRPLDPAAQKAYFGDYYQEALNLVSMAPDLAAVPMLAFLIRELLTSVKPPSAQTRTDLYRKFIGYVFNREENRALKKKALQVRSTLQALAFHSLAAEPSQLGYADYKIFFAHNEGRVSEDDLLGFGLMNALVEWQEKDIDSRLFFTHQSFQEFLAARYAMLNSAARERLLQQMWQPRWREVLKFMVGLDDTGKVIEAVYPGPKADNLIFSRLFLAVACLPEDPRGGYALDTTGDRFVDSY